MFPKSLYPFVLLGLAATLQPHLAHAQGGASSALSLEEDRRRTLYQQGKEAIKAQRWVDAKTKLTDAWTIRPSYDVALSLSQAEFNLDHFAESAQYLAYYFRNVSAKENEKNLTNAKQASFSEGKREEPHQRQAGVRSRQGEGRFGGRDGTKGR